MVQVRMGCDHEGKLLGSELEPIEIRKDNLFRCLGYSRIHENDPLAKEKVLK
jgi:hypothetical protein